MGPLRSKFVESRAKKIRDKETCGVSDLEATAGGEQDCSGSHLSGSGTYD